MHIVVQSTGCSRSTIMDSRIKDGGSRQGYMSSIIKNVYSSVVTVTVHGTFDVRTVRTSTHNAQPPNLKRNFTFVLCGTFARTSNFHFLRYTRVDLLVASRAQILHQRNPIIIELTLYHTPVHSTSSVSSRSRHSLAVKRSMSMSVPQVCIARLAMQNHPCPSNLPKTKHQEDKQHGAPRLSSNSSSTLELPCHAAGEIDALDISYMGMKSEQFFERRQAKLRQNMRSDEYCFYLENKTQAMLKNLKDAQFDQFFDPLVHAPRKSDCKERTDYPDHPLTDEDGDDFGYHFGLCSLDEYKEEALMDAPYSTPSYYSNIEMFRMDF